MRRVTHAGGELQRRKSGPRTDGRLQQAMDRAAQREIEAALSETGGRVGKAATLLGITSRGLSRKMVTLKVKPRRARDEGLLSSWPSERAYPEPATNAAPARSGRDRRSVAWVPWDSRYKVFGVKAFLGVTP